MSNSLFILVANYLKKYNCIFLKYFATGINKEFDVNPFSLF